ncbi:MAG TPA: M56 family metallopeptidase [Planctomycetaceae bacterium]|jgi:beta-lactamase regulating signal transducer with metallopeptidase domain|nr:M56 family metallopeptidase [Planctomycetaceae bacterium]
MTKTFTDVAAELAFAQLWQVTLVIAAAALLTRLACARRAHLAHLIWLVVLIKCLTPPLWSSPTGVFSWALTQSATDAKSAPERAAPGPKALDERLASPIDEGSEMAKLAAAANRPTASNSSTAIPPAAGEQKPIASAGTAPKIVRLLLLGWAIGAVVYAGFAVFLALSSWRAVRRSRSPADESARTLLESLARRLHVRQKTRLVLVNEPLGPMTFGWIRPAIIVPHPLIAGRPPAEVEPLLAHELIHVRRGDALVGMLQLAAQCVWWFHPLVWWANREMGRERERCCDEEVVAGLACPPATYARSLLNVLELKRQLRWLGPLPGLRPFEVTKQRLERLMTHSADFRRRMPRAYWLLLLAGVLVFVPGGRLARSTEEPPANASKSNASVSGPEPTHPKAPTSSSQDASAAAIMQKVYDSFGWIDQVRSFQIRTAYKIRPTAEALRRDQKHPQATFGGVRHLDPRTFHVDSEWAWDAGHIRYAYQNYYEGESLFGRQTRVWDGSLAVEFDERSDHADRGYVFAEKSSLLFSEQDVAQQLMLPWGPGGPHKLWWLPTNVAQYREASGLAPEDFILVGDESVDGRPCHVVETPISGYRLHVGIADGRLYQRTWLLPFGGGGNADQSLAFQKVAGAAVKTYPQYQAWIKSLSPVEQAHAAHRLMTALAEHSPPKRAHFHQTFADYREVAPGRWLPFHQSVDNFSFDGPEPFVEAHIEQQVTEVHVDKQLPQDLFHVELEDGVPVRTDWRYDPPIDYTFRKNQTEAERVALRDAEQKQRATHSSSKQFSLADAQPAGKASENSTPARKTVASGSRKNSRFPRLIDSVPKAGQSDVSADLKDLRVTFDRDMGKGMSWTGNSESFFPPVDESQKARWINPRTCALPVKLEKGKYYRVGINSSGFGNFRSTRGVSFPPSVIYFTTEGASAEVRDRLRVPKIVELNPANGASNVDPSITELRVTFDVPMGKGMSWTGGGPTMPASPPDSRAEWSADGKTCVLPVSLRPGRSYRLGLNSLSFNNFQSESGVPLAPVVYQFKTR